MADLTLADVVKELRIQNSLSEQTNKDILSLTQKFSDLLLQQSIDKQRAAEMALEAGKKSKEAVRDRQNSPSGFGSSLPSGLIDGFLKGSGLGWLGSLVGGMFSNIFKFGGKAFGLLTGGIGLAAGKILKWGFFGGLIVNYFKDEITNWLDPDGDGKMQFMGMEWDANDAKFWGGLSIAAGFIATSLISFVGSSIIGLGSLGLAALFMKIPGLKDIGLAMDTWARGKTPFMPPKRPITPTPAPLGTPPKLTTTSPAPLGTPPVAEPPIITPKVAAQTTISEYLKRGKPLPQNVRITPDGKPMIKGPKGQWRFTSPEVIAQELTKSPATINKPFVPEIAPARSSLMRFASPVLRTAAVIADTTFAPLMGIDIALRAKGLGQDPLTSTVIAAATTPLAFWDALNNLTSMGINKLGDLIGMNPNLQMIDTAGATADKILELLGQSNRAEVEQGKIDLTKPVPSVLSPLPPPRADSSLNPTSESPSATINAQTITDNRNTYHYNNRETFNMPATVVDPNDTIRIPAILQ